MTPTIPEAVQAMPERIYAKTHGASTDVISGQRGLIGGWNEHKRDGQVEYVRADLALPFITGVTVKKLEWKQEDTSYWRASTSCGSYGVNKMKEGYFEMDGDIYADLEAAKAAAQADYEARFWSMAEVLGNSEQLKPSALPFLQGVKVDVDAILKPLDELTVFRGLCYWTEIAAAIGEIRRSLMPISTSTCKTCKGHGIIGGMYRVGDGDVDAWEKPCPDCEQSLKVQSSEISRRLEEFLKDNKDCFFDNDIQTVKEAIHALSAIEVAPSPRAQALDLSALENLSVKADEYDYADDNGPFPDIQDAMVSVGDLRAVRKLLPEIRALSQPVAERVQCERCQGNGEIVTDWERYKHPRANDVGDEAVTECPDCSGYGFTDSQPSHPVSPDMGVERPVEGGWLPIETAPKDTVVLMTWNYQGKWEYEAGIYGSTRGGWLHGQATHWRPLPQAPGVAV